MLPTRTTAGKTAAQIIDLTIPISDGMDAYPGEPTASFSPFSTLARDKVEMWNVSLFSQLGTHVDAPSHFLTGGSTAEAIPLQSCVGPAAVIDIPLGPNAQLTVEHLLPYKDRVTSLGRVILRTGWSSRYGTAEYWTDLPTLHPESARLLVDWGVVFLGLDTPTPSLVDLHEIHEIFLSRGAVIAESLTNVENLHSDQTFLVCLPLPLVGLDGAPARIIAIETNKDTP